MELGEGHSKLGKRLLAKRSDLEGLLVDNPTLAPDPLRSSQAGGGAGAVVDKNHRLHALSRLCHCAWQTFPIGQGDAAGAPQADLPLVALWLAHSVLERL